MMIDEIVTQRLLGDPDLIAKLNSIKELNGPFATNVEELDAISDTSTDVAVQVLRDLLESETEGKPRIWWAIRKAAEEMKLAALLAIRQDVDDLEDESAIPEDLSYAKLNGLIRDARSKINRCEAAFTFPDAVEPL